MRLRRNSGSLVLLNELPPIHTPKEKSYECNPKNQAQKQSQNCCSASRPITKSYLCALAVGHNQSSPPAGSGKDRNGRPHGCQVEYRAIGRGSNAVGSCDGLASQQSK